MNTLHRLTGPQVNWPPSTSSQMSTFGGNGESNWQTETLQHTTPRVISQLPEYTQQAQSSPSDANDSPQDLYVDIYSPHNPNFQFSFPPSSFPMTPWDNPIRTLGPDIRIDTSAVHHTTIQSQYSASQSHSNWPSSPNHADVALPQSPNYTGGGRPPDSYYPLYPSNQISPTNPRSSPTASDVVSPTFGSVQLSPHLYSASPSSPPSTPSSQCNQYAHSDGDSPTVLFAHPAESKPKKLYSHRDQVQLFKDALSLPTAGISGPFVPQPMYKPHTNSDRRRYVEEVDLEGPIEFWTEHPNECGIPLSDAMHSRVKRLLNRDETVFEGRGPSVSIRLEWPGYRQWSRQIPTKDFRSPPGPITRAKLAKNVAKCVQRFIAERQNHSLEDDADGKWRVGTGQDKIGLDDLILVSIHHVSMGSWQPHLRLRQPFRAQS